MNKKHKQIKQQLGSSCAYFGCISLSCTRGSRGGIMSAPTSLQMKMRAMQISSMLLLFRS